MLQLLQFIKAANKRWWERMRVESWSFMNYQGLHKHAIKRSWARAEVTRATSLYVNKPAVLPLFGPTTGLSDKLMYCFYRLSTLTEVEQGSEHINSCVVKILIFLFSRAKSFFLLWAFGSTSHKNSPASLWLSSVPYHLYPVGQLPDCVDRYHSIHSYENLFRLSWKNLSSYIRVFTAPCMATFYKKGTVEQ